VSNVITSTNQLDGIESVDTSGRKIIEDYIREGEARTQLLTEKYRQRKRDVAQPTAKSRQP